MMSKSRLIIKTISVVVAGVFLCQQVVWAAGGADGLTATAGKSINVPAALAHVDTSRKGNGGDFVVNIQDNHSSLSTQYSIVNVLKELLKEYDLNIIAIEGGSGFADTSVLRSLPEADVRESTAAYLMREGKISAGEFFSATAEDDVAVYGVEDSDLYAENLKCFREIHENNAPNLLKIKSILNGLRAEEKQVYSPALQKAVYKARLHNESKISFDIYWDFLEEACRENGVSTEGHESIAVFLEAVRLEKDIDFARATSERKQLTEDLTQVLGKGELEDMVVRTLRFSNNEIAPEEYHKGLIALAVGKGLDTSLYPELLKYAAYTDVYRDLNIAGLQRELDSIEKALTGKLLSSEEERTLYSSVRLMELCRGLFEIKLSSGDVRYLTAHIGELGSDPGTADLVPAATEALKFYEVAEKRNETMLANTVAAMRREGKHAAALISGGHHSGGLADIMRAKDLSYLVIMPRIFKEENRPYVAVLTRKTGPYRELVSAGKYDLALEALFDNNDPATFEQMLAFSIGQMERASMDFRPMIDLWVDSYRDMQETLSPARREAMKFTPMTPEELRGYLESVSVDEEGLVVIGENTYRVTEEGVVVVGRGAAPDAEGMRADEARGLLQTVTSLVPDWWRAIARIRGERFLDRYRRGLGFPYDEQALEAAVDARDRREKRDFVSPVPEDEEGGFLKKQVGYFLRDIINTKAYHEGKVMLNFDIEFWASLEKDYPLHKTDIYVSWLRSGWASRLGMQDPPEEGDTLDFTGIAIDPTDGTVSIMGFPGGTRFPIPHDMRTGVSNGPVAIVDIARVTKPLNEEELRDWREAITNYERTNFGSITAEKVQRHTHVDGFIPRESVTELKARGFETFPLPSTKTLAAHMFGSKTANRIARVLMAPTIIPHEIAHLFEALVSGRDLKGLRLRNLITGMPADVRGPPALAGMLTNLVIGVAGTILFHDASTVLKGILLAVAVINLAGFGVDLVLPLIIPAYRPKSDLFKAFAGPINDGVTIGRSKIEQALIFASDQRAEIKAQALAVAGEVDGQFASRLGRILEQLRAGESYNAVLALRKLNAEFLTREDTGLYLGLTLKAGEAALIPFRIVERKQHSTPERAVEVLYLEELEGAPQPTNTGFDIPGEKFVCVVRTNTETQTDAVMRVLTGDGTGTPEGSRYYEAQPVISGLEEIAQHALRKEFLGLSRERVREMIEFQIELHELKHNEFDNTGVEYGLRQEVDGDAINEAMAELTSIALGPAPLHRVLKALEFTVGPNENRASARLILNELAVKTGFRFRADDPEEAATLVSRMMTMHPAEIKKAAREAYDGLARRYLAGPIDEGAISVAVDKFDGRSEEGEHAIVSADADQEETAEDIEDRLSKSQRPLTEADIRMLNERILSEAQGEDPTGFGDFGMVEPAGEYRKSPIGLSRPNGQASIHLNNQNIFGEQMAEFIDWLDSGDSLIEYPMLTEGISDTNWIDEIDWADRETRASMAFWILHEVIHPFIQGNRRTAWRLLNILRRRAGLALIPKLKRYESPWHRTLNGERNPLPFVEFIKKSQLDERAYAVNYGDAIESLETLFEVIAREEGHGDAGAVARSFDGSPEDKKNILDVGSGDDHPLHDYFKGQTKEAAEPRYRAEFRGVNVASIDPSLEDDSEMGYVRGNALVMDMFPDDHFDSVFCEHVFNQECFQLYNKVNEPFWQEHFQGETYNEENYYRRIASELNRVVRPGGKVYQMAGRGDNPVFNAAMAAAGFDQELVNTEHGMRVFVKLAVPQPGSPAPELALKYRFWGLVSGWVACYAAMGWTGAFSALCVSLAVMLVGWYVHEKGHGLGRIIGKSDAWEIKGGPLASAMLVAFFAAPVALICQGLIPNVSIFNVSLLAVSLTAFASYLVHSVADDGALFEPIERDPELRDATGREIMGYVESINASMQAALYEGTGQTVTLPNQRQEKLDYYPFVPLEAAMAAKLILRQDFGDRIKSVVLVKGAAEWQVLSLAYGERHDHAWLEIETHDGRRYYLSFVDGLYSESFPGDMTKRYTAVDDETGEEYKIDATNPEFLRWYFRNDMDHVVFVDVTDNAAYDELKGEGLGVRETDRGRRVENEVSAARVHRILEYFGTYEAAREQLYPEAEGEATGEAAFEGMLADLGLSDSGIDLELVDSTGQSWDEGEIMSVIEELGHEEAFRRFEAQTRLENLIRSGGRRLINALAQIRVEVRGREENAVSLLVRNFAEGDILLRIDAIEILMLLATGLRRDHQVLGQIASAQVDTIFGEESAVSTAIRCMASDDHRIKFLAQDMVKAFAGAENRYLRQAIADTEVMLNDGRETVVSVLRKDRDSNRRNQFLNSRAIETLAVLARYGIEGADDGKGPAPTKTLAAHMFGSKTANRIARVLMAPAIIPHEMAHLFEALVSGRDLKGFRLWSLITGMPADVRGPPALAGMLTNLVIGVTGTILFHDASTILKGVLLAAALINLAGFGMDLLLPLVIPSYRPESDLLKAFTDPGSRTEQTNRALEATYRSMRDLPDALDIGRMRQRREVIEFKDGRLQERQGDGLYVNVGAPFTGELQDNLDGVIEGLRAIETDPSKLYSGIMHSTVAEIYPDTASRHASGVTDEERNSKLEDAGKALADAGDVGLVFYYKDITIDDKGNVLALGYVENDNLFEAREAMYAVGATGRVKDVVHITIARIFDEDITPGKLEEYRNYIRGLREKQDAGGNPLVLGRVSGLDFTVYDQRGETLQDKYVKHHPVFEGNPDYIRGPPDAKALAKRYAARFNVLREIHGENVLPVPGTPETDITPYQREARKAIENVVTIATDSRDEVALTAIAPLFRDIVEYNNDELTAESRNIYSKIFTLVISVARNAPACEAIDKKLRGIRINDEEDLYAHYENVRNQRSNFDAANAEKVGKVAILSRMTIGADIAVTSAIIERLKVEYPNAGIVIIGDKRIGGLFESDSRVSVAPIKYSKGGTLAVRLNSWIDLADMVEELAPDYIFSPSSRLDQLGILPLTDTERYFFWGSAVPEGQKPRALTLMMNEWMNNVFGTPGAGTLYYPALHMGSGHTADAGKVWSKYGLADKYVISAKYDVGGNHDKSLGTEFEKAHLPGLLSEDGSVVVMDRGFGDEELAHSQVLIDEAARLGARIIDITDIADGSGVGNRIDEMDPADKDAVEGPTLIVFHGSVAGWAALVGKTDEAFSYDSVGQHIAAALNVPVVIAFTGYRTKFFPKIWTPMGRAEVVSIRTGPGQSHNAEVILGRVMQAHRGIVKRSRQTPPTKPPAAVNWLNLIVAGAGLYFLPQIAKTLPVVSAVPMPAATELWVLFIAFLAIHELAHFMNVVVRHMANRSADKPRLKDVFYRAFPGVTGAGVVVEGAEGWEGMMVSGLLALVSIFLVPILPQYALPAFIVNIVFALSINDIKLMVAHTRVLMLSDYVRGQIKALDDEFIPNRFEAQDKIADIARRQIGNTGILDGIAASDAIDILARNSRSPDVLLRGGARETLAELALTGNAKILLKLARTGSIRTLAKETATRSREARIKTRAAFMRLALSKSPVVLNAVVSSGVIGILAADIKPVQYTIERERARSAIDVLHQFVYTGDDRLLVAIALAKTGEESVIRHLIDGLESVNYDEDLFQIVQTVLVRLAGSGNKEAVGALAREFDAVVRLLEGESVLSKAVVKAMVRKFAETGEPVLAKTIGEKFPDIVRSLAVRDPLMLTAIFRDLVVKIDDQVILSDIALTEEDPENPGRESMVAVLAGYLAHDELDVRLRAENVLIEVCESGNADLINAVARARVTINGREYSVPYLLTYNMTDESVDVRARAGMAHLKLAEYGTPEYMYSLITDETGLEEGLTAFDFLAKNAASPSIELSAWADAATQRYINRFRSMVPEADMGHLDIISRAIGRGDTRANIEADEDTARILKRLFAEIKREKDSSRVLADTHGKALKFFGWEAAEKLSLRQKICVGWYAAVAEVWKPFRPIRFLREHYNRGRKEEAIRGGGIVFIWASMAAIFGGTLITLAAFWGIPPAMGSLVGIVAAIPANILAHGVYNTAAALFGLPSLSIFDWKNMIWRRKPLSILEAAERNIRQAAKTMGLDPVLVKEFLEPERVTEISFRMELDSGETLTFWAFRALQNNALGAGKGGLRWLVNHGETLEEAKTTAVGLSTLMSIKNAGVGIPYGGGKGDIFVEDRNYTDNDKARIMRAFARGLTEQNAVGTLIDVPAPDQGTGAAMMAWFTDEHLRVLADRGEIYDKTLQKVLEGVVPEDDPLATPYLDMYTGTLQNDTEGRLRGIELGVITGKPIGQGGSEGRTKATGFGGFLAVKSMFEYFAQVPDMASDHLGKNLNDETRALLKRNIKGMTVAIQGTGNVGEYNAWEFFNAGAKVCMLQDIKHTLYHPDGINLNMMNEELERFPDGRWAALETISPEWLERTGCKLLGAEGKEFFWREHTNIKVPAATENQITRRNARKVNCEILLELANNPTTPRADKILSKRGILVIPDVFANAGGVTVSYFEWLQNIEGKYWNGESVDKMLEYRVETEARQMVSIAERFEVGLREAVYILSLAKISDAEIARNVRFRGLFGPGKKIPYRGYGELGLDPATVEELAQVCDDGGLGELIARNEREQDVEITNIAEVAMDRLGDEGGFVLISGPSTGGKMKFTQHLAANLTRSGLSVREMDLDGALDRVVGQMRANGVPEEDIYELSLVKLSLEMDKVLTGEFKRKPGEIVVLYSDFALCERMRSILEGERTFGIFVNTAPGLKLKGNWPLTSLDLRFMRHILSQRQRFRQDPLESVRDWARIRDHDLNYVYPLWKNADVTFNSYSSYELPVLKPHLEPLLREALERTDQEADIKAIKHLLLMLEDVPPVTPELPALSIRRQFVADGSERVTAQAVVTQKTRVEVNSDESYDVVMTRDVFNPENLLLKQEVNGRNTFFVVDKGIGAERIAALKNYIRATGVNADPEKCVMVVPGGEKVKNGILGLYYVLKTMRQARRAGIDRKSTFVLVGGGATLDMAGFAATVFHRGAEHVRIPSTLLSQDDAGVGVKNGINFFGQKNFMGTFQPPQSVLIDPLLMSTASRQLMSDGLAEAIKVTLMKDRAGFEYLEEHYETLLYLPEVLRGEMPAELRERYTVDAAPGRITPEENVLRTAEQLIWMSANNHVEQISTDPMEKRLARPLDYGHQWGHRLEVVTRHRLSHGQGVGIGMAIDSYISWKRGYITGGEFDRIIRAILNAELPVSDRAATFKNLWQGLEEFRAHLGGELTISLLGGKDAPEGADGIGKKQDVSDITEAELKEAVENIAEVARTGVSGDGLTPATANPDRIGFIGEQEKNREALDAIRTIDKPTKIALVIPLYNEERRLRPWSPDNDLGEDALREKVKAFKKLSEVNPNFDWQLILVDDGTENEASKEEATRLWNEIRLEEGLDESKVKIIAISRDDKEKLRSVKGGAIHRGFSEAINTDADYIGYTDIDTSIDLRQMALLLKQLYDGKTDVAIGSRWCRDGVASSMGIFEKMSSRIYNGAVRLILWPLRNIRDTQRGFKLFKREVLEDIGPFTTDNSLAFDTELLLLSKMAGYRVQETAIAWYESEKARTFSMSKQAPIMLGHLFLQAWKYLKHMLLISRLDFGRRGDRPPLSFDEQWRTMSLKQKTDRLSEYAETHAAVSVRFGEQVDYGEKVRAVQWLADVADRPEEPLAVRVHAKYLYKLLRRVYKIISREVSARTADMGNYEEVHLSIISDSHAHVSRESQMADCLKKLDRFLDERGISRGDVAKQNVFVRDANNTDFFDTKGRLSRQLAEFYAANGRAPPTSFIGEFPEDYNDVAMECTILVPKTAAVQIEAKTLEVEYEGRMHTVGYKVVVENGVKQVHVEGLTVSAETDNVEDQSRGAFVLMKAVLDAEGMEFTDIVRQWNYVERIVDMEPYGNEERQRYRIFNDVRGEFYPEKAAWVNGYPAATGIGMGVGGVVLGCVAVKELEGRVDIVALPNPLQIDAHAYSKQAQAGTSPKFERAKAVVAGGKVRVFVSGTAGIRGEDTENLGDVEKQTEMTIENIEALISRENLENHGIDAGATLRDVSQFRVYVKHERDMLRVKRICDEKFGDSSVQYLVADVCRPNLLMEIEAIATVSGRMRTVVAPEAREADESAVRERAERISVAVRSLGHDTVGESAVLSGMAEAERHVPAPLQERFTRLLNDLRSLYGEVEQISISERRLPDPEETADWSRRLTAITTDVRELAAEPGIQGSDVVSQTLNEAIPVLESRLGLAAGEIKKEYVDVAGLIKSKYGTHAGVEISGSAVNKHLNVSGDRVAIFNAIVNLVENGLEAAAGAPEGAAVRIMMEEENGRLMISIRDNGTGLDEVSLGMGENGRARIFDLNNSTKAMGTGLGTTEAWYAARDHGGNISALPNDYFGSGTTFFLSLPLDKEVETTFVVIGVVGIPSDVVLELDEEIRDRHIRLVPLEEGGENALEVVEKYRRRYNAHSAGVIEDIYTHEIDDAINAIVAALGEAAEKDSTGFIERPDTVSLSSDTEVALIEATMRSLTEKLQAIEPLRLAEASVPELRKYEHKFSNVAKRAAIEIPVKKFEGEGVKVATFRAENIAELRWLAEEHLKTTETYEAEHGEGSYPVKLHVRLTDGNVDAENLDKVLELAGIDDIITREDITLGDGGSLSEIFSIVEENYAGQFKVTAKDVAVGDVRELALDEDFLKEALYVRMPASEGIQSQLYSMVVTLMANRNARPESLPDGVRALEQPNSGIFYFIFVPAKPVNMEELRLEMQRYERVLVAA